jgi:hypothetical protein
LPRVTWKKEWSRTLDNGRESESHYRAGSCLSRQGLRSHGRIAGILFSLKQVQTLCDVPTKCEFVINPHTAKALGLSAPAILYQRIFLGGPPLSPWVKIGKNPRKALTLTDMVWPRGKPVAFLVPQNHFRFLEKNHRWCGSIYHSAVPETFAMVDGRNGRHVRGGRG